MEPVPAADHSEEAVAAAHEAARRLGLKSRDVTVLHQSNNVLVRIGDVAFKVGVHRERIRREVDLARHASDAGGPVLRPLADPIQSGSFVVSPWPYVQSDPTPANEEAARALAALHHSLAKTPHALPRLADRFGEVHGLLDDEVATAALPQEGRGVLREAVAALAPVVESSVSTVLHTEPHDGNRLTVGGSVVYLDLERVSIGPLEWDLAYFGQEVAERVWPQHDLTMRQHLRVGVSACVSTYCWRHLSARPEETAMRWHAEHHLTVVREALAGP